MFVITIEYFTGSYKDGEKQYKLTTVRTNIIDYEQELIEKFGVDNYHILDVEVIRWLAFS